MKQFIFGLVCALSLTAFGQHQSEQSPFKKLKEVVFTANGKKQPVKYKRNNNYLYKLDSIENYDFDEFVGDFSLSSVQKLSYSNDHKTIEKYFDNGVTPFYKYVFNYNDEGYLIRQNNVEWNDSLGGFDTTNTTIYTYNTDGLLTKSLYSNTARTEYSLDSLIYDANGRLIEEYYVSKDLIYPEYDTDEKILISWDATGKLDKYEIYEQENGTSTLVYYVEATYDGGTNAYEFLFAEEFVPVVGTPIYDEKWVAELTNWGVSETDFYYYKENPAGDWELLDVDSSLYGPEKNLIDSKYYFNEGGQGMILSSTSKYEYDRSKAIESTLIPNGDIYASLDFEYKDFHANTEYEYQSYGDWPSHRKTKYYYSDIETNIAENELKTLSVCPNPVTETLYWELDKSQEVSIYNLQGKLVQYEPAAKGKADVSHLPQGTYILHAVNGKDVFTARFIKN